MSYEGSSSVGLSAALGQGRQLKFDKGVEQQNWRLGSQDVVKLIKNRAAGTPSHKTTFFQFQCENTGPTSRSSNQSNSLTTGSRFHPAASLSASQGPGPLRGLWIDPGCPELWCLHTLCIFSQQFWRKCHQWQWLGAQKHHLKWKKIF